MELDGGMLKVRIGLDQDTQSTCAVRVDVVERVEVEAAKVFCTRRQTAPRMVITALVVLCRSWVGTGTVGGVWAALRTGNTHCCTGQDAQGERARC